MGTDGQKGSVEFAVFTKPWPQDGTSDLAGHVSSMGFDAAEVPVRPGFQVEPKDAAGKLTELVATFADHGVRIASIASSLEEPIFAACQAAGVGVIRVMAPIARGDYAGSEQRVQRAIGNAAPLCERYGVRVGVQEHYGDYVSSSPALRAFLKNLDPRLVGAVWDSAHDAIAGVPPETGLDALWDRLIMVNLKNACYKRISGNAGMSAEWEVEFTSGREGLASWPRIVSVLRRKSYSGTVCLTAEYSAAEEVDRLCKEDLAYVKELFS